MSSEVGTPGIVRNGVDVPQTNLAPGEIPLALYAELEA